MRRAFRSSLGACAVGICLVGASPALAATQVTQERCATQGGDFTSVKGVKTCTTVSDSYEFEGLFLSSEPEPDPANPSGTVYYTSASRVTIFLRTTTVQRQKAKGAVTTTTTTTEIERSTSFRTCTATHEAAGVETSTATAPYSDCESRDLIPA